MLDVIVCILYECMVFIWYESLSVRCIEYMGHVTGVVDMLLQSCKI